MQHQAAPLHLPQTPPPQLPHEQPAPRPPAPIHQAPQQVAPNAPLSSAQAAQGNLVPKQSRWAVFEHLGLGKPKEKAPGPNARLSAETRKLLVSAYRLLGFVILTIIVVVLIGYLITTAFYFVSDSWVQPMVVSETDERVLQLQAQLSDQENTRDRLIADLNHAERYIEVQQNFQAEFAEAIKADLKGRKSALRRIRGLAKTYAGARKRIKSSNSAYARASRKRMSQEYRAGLIDRSDMLSGKFQLAQITNSNLSLAERQAEYENRAADLENQAMALDAILSKKGGDGALSYEVLRIKQEYELSRLETAKAIENRKALQASLERQEGRIDALKQSPYLRAIAEDANIAFVPYSNMDNVSVGETVYGCHLEMFLCGRVGEVLEILPGEVTFKHPHREKVLRGQMISIDLDDDEKDAAEDDVLFVGGRPMLL